MVDDTKQKQYVKQGRSINNDRVPCLCTPCLCTQCLVLCLLVACLLVKGHSKGQYV